MGNLRQIRAPFGVCDKRRKSWLLLASSSLGVSEPAIMKQPPLGWSRDPVHPSSRRKRTPSYVISIVFAASFVLGGFAAAPAQAQVIENPVATVPPDLIPSGATLLVGVNGGTGTVNINPTGSVTLNALGIGGTEGIATIGIPLPPGTGTVNVTGPNANLVVNNQIFVGPTFAGPSGPGSGTLNITGGGTVTQGSGSNAFMEIGGGAAGGVPGTGTVLVSGSGSTLSTPSALINIGQFGTGTLTIENGGVVNAFSVQVYGPNSTGGGTLNIGAAPGQPAAAPGRLNLDFARVQLQGSSLTTPGTGIPVTLNFTHTSKDGSYVFLPAIVGTLTPGVANNGVVNVFAGTTVYKPDTGVLAFGSPPYGGQTTIFSGATWAAGEVNAFSRNSNTVVNSGGTLNLQGFSQSLLNDGESRNPFSTTTVTKAGTVLLGVPGVTPPGTTLTVNNYVGNGGIMAMNTFLGTDGSASDKLVISGGTGTGQSLLRVTNTGGGGALTVSDGILVVQAVNGATTTPTAFSLQGGSVTAGAFDYFLFRGGVSAGSQNSWFLRSTLVATPEPEPTPPGLPDPVPGAPPVLLFQPGVAVMSVVPSIARSLG